MLKQQLHPSNFINLLKKILSIFPIIKGGSNKKLKMKSKIIIKQNKKL